MPEVFIDDNTAADTSSTSVEATDGDASYDSMGGLVVSHWRDVFAMRGRREIDLVVTKKIVGGPQIPLLVVEIKRDDLDLRSAMTQIEDYLTRVVARCVVLNIRIPIYGLLVVGVHSLRLVASWDPRANRSIILSLRWPYY